MNPKDDLWKAFSAHLGRAPTHEDIMVLRRLGDFVMLTEKQSRILQIYVGWQRAHGYSPTMKEVGGIIGKSVGCVYEHIQALIKHGLIERSVGNGEKAKNRGFIPTYAGFVITGGAT